MSSGKHLFIAIIIVTAAALFAVEQGKGKTLVLETSMIEGKIKKPQAALISLEKRPVFKPMALSSLNTRKDITKDIDNSVFESRLYDKAFDIPDEKNKN